MRLSDTGDLDWNEVAEGFEAESHNGNTYRLVGALGAWRLEAQIKEEFYNLPFEKQAKAVDMAEELEVQSLA